VGSEARNEDRETLLQSAIFYQTWPVKPELEIDQFPHSGSTTPLPAFHFLIMYLELAQLIYRMENYFDPTCTHLLLYEQRYWTMMRNINLRRSH